MRIRYATQSDLGFLSQDEYAPAGTVARKIEAREVIVAETDSKLTGYARIEYLWSKVPYLALIRVLPDSQRQGVGRALLSFLERSFVQRAIECCLVRAKAMNPNLRLGIGTWVLQKADISRALMKVK